MPQHSASAPEDLEEQRICFNCVDEPYLKAEIQASAEIAACTYCGKQAASIDLDALSDRVHAAFEQHYVRTPDQPSGLEYALMKDDESNYSWEREGEQTVYAIMNAAHIPEQAAEDIRTILEDKHTSFDDAAIGEEDDYDSDAHYEEKGVSAGRWEFEWDRFENSLRTEARFFSRDAETLLASVFEGIDKLKTKDTSNVLVKAGPDTALQHLYRARVFQSDHKLAEALKNLDRELGSPPPAVAMAGRMNARGISVFYGATNAATALAEIRPPVGSRVLSGQFCIVRPIQLLDLAALGKVTVKGSVFDPKFGRDLERSAFLEILGARMTRPVMPDDEALDYLTTQAVADYLATNASIPIDGIIYRSAQTPSHERNVVLFHKASYVERLIRPYGTEVSSSTGHWSEDGWETEYEIIESIPPADAKAPANTMQTLIQGVDQLLSQIEDDARKPTLRLEKESVRVNDITGVTFAYGETTVRHFRWEKKDDSEF